MPPRSADDDLLNDDDDELFADAPNPHASSTRWRHQESAAYHKAAGPSGGKHRHPLAREPEARGGRVNELTDFLNSSRISPEEAKRETGSRPTNGKAPRSKPVMAEAAEAEQTIAAVKDGETNGGGVAVSSGAVDATMDGTVAEHTPDVREIACGPLLNYRRTEGNQWVGSVLVVTRGGGKTQGYVPTLNLTRAGSRVEAPATNGNGEKANGAGADHSAVRETNGGAGSPGREISAICLYSDHRNTFWRFDLMVPIEATEVEWAYTLPDLTFPAKSKKPQRNTFFVAAETESMRMMFHSCNGFSVGTDEEAWSGPCLWNDVMRRHREAPFHVMIGGGDQIYNDGIRVNGPLRPWTDISNPKKRRDYPFPEKLRQDCDDYYLKNYLRWYATEPFAAANGQIAQLNIWDDHDIIDGFGSYVNEFMKCDVFRGIGGTAHKYYMLFQHHLPPPRSTYTTDAPPAANGEEGQGLDPNQIVNTFVHEPIPESNYIVGSRPGPYVAEHSQSMFARLGARIAFLGIDARTERTRHQVNYPETYDMIFARLRQELGSAASSGNPYRHLILLLGIPIAYPRLTWLENIFTSPLMGPIKLLNRRFGFAGGVFNHFDGSVDLLDDLDDHYTARTHKKERNRFLERLQTICAEFSIRITILGGDVHLAALGRFYSAPALNIPTVNDFRYMANVVSSAIVNKPPPQAIANLLARRNKIHHLNSDTDETLMNLFDKDPGRSERTATHNHVTMPSRNFAVITENSPNNPPDATESHARPASPSAPPLPTQPEQYLPLPESNGGPNGVGSLRPTSSAGLSKRSGRSGKMSTKSSRSKLSAAHRAPHRHHSSGSTNAGHGALHAGEVGAGTQHKAASPTAHGKGNDGGLDVCIRVEIDQRDPEGRTEAYGMTIPLLAYDGPVPELGPELATLPGSSAGNRSDAGDAA